MSESTVFDFTQISNITIDPETGNVTFVTIDGQVLDNFSAQSKASNFYTIINNDSSQPFCNMSVSSSQIVSQTMLFDTNGNKNFTLAKTGENDFVVLDNLKITTCSIETVDGKDVLKLVDVYGKEYTFQAIDLASTDANKQSQYIITDLNGNLIGSYIPNDSSLTLSTSYGTSKIQNFTIDKEGNGVNMQNLYVESAEYDAKSNTLTLNGQNDSSFVFDIEQKSDAEEGIYVIKDSKGNVIGEFNSNTNEINLTQSGGNSYSFVETEEGKLNNLDNITSANYKLNEDGKGGTITLYDGEKSYTVKLTLNEDGTYQIKNGNFDIGTFDPSQNSITLGEETFNFVVDKNGTLVNMKQLQVQEGNFVPNGKNSTITCVASDGREYVFGIVDKEEDGIYSVVDSKGNEIGEFNKNTGELDFTKSNGSKFSFEVTKNNKFLSLEELDIAYGKYNTEKKEITFIDSNGEKYTFTLGESKNIGQHNIRCGDNNVGTFNINTGEITITTGKEPQPSTFMISNDNVFFKLEDLKPKTLDFELGSDGQKNIVSITNENGMKCSFEFTINEEDANIYEIKDLNGNSIATFNSSNSTLTIGDTTITYNKTNDGTFVDMNQLEYKDAIVDYDTNTITIQDKDGSSFTFDLVDDNHDDIYVIRDGNGTTIGTVERGDITSNIELNCLGEEPISVLTMTGEVKDFFNDFFENNDFSDYINNNDYSGLKDEIKNRLESMLQDKNPELLEKTSQVIDDINLDGVSTKEQFMKSLNNSLKENNFNTVDDINLNVAPEQNNIKNFFQSIDWTGTGAIITYCAASALLTFLIGLLISHYNNKDEEKDEHKTTKFTNNVKPKNNTASSVYEQKEEENPVKNKTQYHNTFEEKNKNEDKDGYDNKPQEIKNKPIPHFQDMHTGLSADDRAAMMENMSSRGNRIKTPILGQ